MQFVSTSYIALQSKSITSLNTSQAIGYMKHSPKPLELKLD